MSDGMTALSADYRVPPESDGASGHRVRAHHGSSIRSGNRRCCDGSPLSRGPIHHLRLTVTDVQRSRAFYTELLGFQIAMDAPPPADDPHYDLTTDLLQGGIVMVNGDLLLGCASGRRAGC
jgi:Glyoxalase/Bleomycin resistance protein/Dioxygenase superfamily